MNILTSTTASLSNDLLKAELKFFDQPNYFTFNDMYTNLLTYLEDEQDIISNITGTKAPEGGINEKLSRHPYHTQLRTKIPERKLTEKDVSVLSMQDISPDILAPMFERYNTFERNIVFSILQQYDSLKEDIYPYHVNVMQVGQKHLNEKMYLLTELPQRAYTHLIGKMNDIL